MEILRRNLGRFQGAGAVGVGGEGDSGIRAPDAVFAGAAAGGRCVRTERTAAGEFSSFTHLRVRFRFLSSYTSVPHAPCSKKKRSEDVSDVSS